MKYNLLPPDKNMMILDGSSKQGELIASPAELAAALGEPTWKPGDFCAEVDTSWIFTDEEGHMFDVYAYKATSLYEDDLPTPEQFWSGNGLFAFSIGGMPNVPTTGFAQFIQSKVPNANIREKFLANGEKNESY